MTIVYLSKHIFVNINPWSVKNKNRIFIITAMITHELNKFIKFIKNKNK